MQEYLGIEFDEGNQNCFTLMRQYLADVYQINDIPDYACPTNWYAREGFDFFSSLAKQNGFQIVEDDWKDGDVLLMAIGSTFGVANHCAIIVNDGKEILHHLTGRLSELSEIRGFWRRAVINVYRHKSIIDKPTGFFNLKENTYVLESV